MSDTSPTKVESSESAPSKHVSASSECGGDLSTIRPYSIVKSLIVAVACAIFHAVDVGLTCAYAVITSQAEANFIARWALETWGIRGLIGVKVASVLAVLAVVLTIATRTQHSASHRGVAIDVILLLTLMSLAVTCFLWAIHLVEVTDLFRQYIHP